MPTFAEAIDKARRLFRAGDAQRSESIYRQLVKAFPQSAVAWNELGLLMLHTHRLDNGAEYLRRAVGLDRQVASYHVNLAVVCRMLNRPKEAIASFAEAIRLEPPTPEILSNLALCLKDTGDPTAALTVFGEALRMRPDYAAAHFHRGNLLLDQRSLVEAADSFQRVIELQPSDPFANCQLGLVYREMSRMRSDRLGPPIARAEHDALGAKQDQLERAVACFRRALELKPDFLEVDGYLTSTLAEERALAEVAETFRRGQTRLAGEQLDEAAECFEQVLEHYPHVVEAHYALGLVRSKQRQVCAAIACFRQAIALEPKYSPGGFQLALALAEDNRIAEAVACLEQVLSDDHDCSAARETLETLRARLNRTEDVGAAHRMPYLRALQAAERQVKSQNGEDGVLDLLFAELGTTNKFFIEFGCGDATECNGAYLLERGWTGLQMDGLMKSANPRAVVHNEFITAENVNDVFRKHGAPEAFDLLSIDIDGNDFWVWRAITSRPCVVLIEYNATIPPTERLTVPYAPAFEWDGSDFFGASLRALKELGEEKGYALVYCDRCGVNAFFVAKELLPAGFEPPAIEEIYRLPNYCDWGLRHRHQTTRKMIDPFADVGASERHATGPSENS